MRKPSLLLIKSHVYLYCLMDFCCYVEQTFKAHFALLLGLSIFCDSNFILILIPILGFSSD